MSTYRPVDLDESRRIVRGHEDLVDAAKSEHVHHQAIVAGLALIGVIDPASCAAYEAAEQRLIDAQMELMRVRGKRIGVNEAALIAAIKDEADKPGLRLVQGGVA